MNGFGLARIGRDVELRYGPSGTAVANISLAFSYFAKSERQTQWVDAAMFGERAEKLAPYLKKGGLVSVVLGNVALEEYQSQGEKRTKLSARVIEIELAGSKDEEPRQQKPAQSKPAQSKSSSNFDDTSDDIPF